ncbi:MAG: MoaD/ThiS family protein [Vulcanimicrobiaceae bacterium]
MKIRLIAFARARELLGSAERGVTLPAGSTRIEDLWHALVATAPRIEEVRPSLRVARNGRLASFDDELADGDEVALLPPVGGG